VLNPLLLLRGKTLGGTIYRSLIAVAVLGLLAYVGFVIVTGRWANWKLRRTEAVLEVTQQRAAVAEINATNADGAAANASVTRADMDLSTSTIRETAAAAAERIENDVDELPLPEGADPAPGLDPSVVRELETADRKARAAADRLLGTRAR